MVARVRMGGQLLDLKGGVDQLKDSFIWQSKDYSGCFQASFTFTPPTGHGGRRFTAAWWHIGALVDIMEGGRRSWRGVVVALTPGDDGVWQVTCNGLGFLLSRFPAWEAATGVPTGTLTVKESVTPDSAVDYAHTNLGLPVYRNGSLLGGGTIQTTDTPRMLSELLVQAAVNTGLKFYVGASGMVSMRADPTTPKWQAVPSSAYLSTLDDNYVSHLPAVFLDSNVTPNVNAWLSPAGQAAAGAAMAAKYGTQYRIVNLVGMGPMTRTAAQQNLDGRYGLVGARLGLVDPVSLTRLNVRRIGQGPTSPLGVRAGDMLRVPAVFDNRTTQTTRVNLDFVIGELVRDHATGTAVATPVGFPGRDFDGALAAGQATTSPDTDVLTGT